MSRLLVLARPSTLNRLRLLPPTGLARRCASSASGASAAPVASLVAVDSPTASASSSASSAGVEASAVLSPPAGTTPMVPIGPIVIDSTTGVVPTGTDNAAPVPAPAAESVATSSPAAELVTVPVPAELQEAASLATVPIPMGPELPPGVTPPVEDIPGWFFGTHGLFALPMRGLEAYIAGIHDLTGAPWWATIVLATLGARAAMVPLMVMQSRNVANMAKIKPTLDDLTERLKDAYAKDNYESAARFQNQISDLMAKHNVKPYSTMVGAIVQIPVWMTFFFTLRGILGRTHDPHGFNEGGLLWFPDLTAADPYYILPVSCGATFFAMASIDVMGAGGPVDEKQQMMRNAMKVVAVMMVPMTASFESGVFVYWTTSNILTVAQSRALRTPEVRAAIGMPPLAATVGASGTASPGSYAPPLDKPFVPEVTYAKPPERAREPVAAKASQRKRRKRR